MKELKVKKSDFYKCLFFIIFWLVPLFYTNLTLQKVPFIPRFIAALYSTSNLFTHATPVWPMLYLQVQEDGASTWRTLDERDYFPMETFGYRTRLFEAVFLAMNIKDYQMKQNGVRDELLDWVAREYRQRSADGKKLRRARIVTRFYETDENKPPRGRWLKPSVSEYHADEFFIIKEKVFE